MALTKTTVTLVQILDAIETTLSAATTVNRSQAYDELTESIPAGDLPLLQVYPESGKVDAQNRGERTTFRGNVRQSEFVVIADYYAAQRSHIDQDMTAVVNGLDAMNDIFDAQTTRPYFSLAGIDSFAWSWERVTFEYGDSATRYAGIRFTITVWVF